MKGQQFAYKGQTFKIAEIMETAGVVRECGWTHIAEVKRPKGTKGYYANLFISNGEILHSVVVL